MENMILLSTRLSAIRAAADPSAMPRSSGVNAQKIVVDAGMEINYFDRDVVRRGR